MNKITIKFGTELKPTHNSCKSQLYNKYRHSTNYLNLKALDKKAKVQIQYLEIQCLIYDKKKWQSVDLDRRLYITPLRHGRMHMWMDLDPILGATVSKGRGSVG